MILTLSGENSFGWQSVLDELVAKFIAEQGELALERIDGEEAELSRISESINSLPFLSSKKLVILRAPSNNKSFQESVEQVLANIPETTDIIILEPKLDKRLAYYKYLKSKTDYREFNELDIGGMASWLVARAKALDAELSLGDARYLANRVGLNQLMLGNELDKLVLYNSKITRQTIDLLTEETPQSTIFQLLEAAFNGNARTAIKIYKEQRELKVEPIQIIAMLAWQLHVLAVIKTAADRSANQIASEAKISPYVVSKSQSIAKVITLAELKALIKDLLEIDIKSKSTNIDTDEALQLYILKLARK